MDLRGLRLDGQVLMAPMAGLTDVAFRRMCREAGAAMVFTEMVSGSALLRGSPRTMRIARTIPEEQPVALQLFGSDPDVMAMAIRAIEEKHADTVRPAMYDLNAGCPVKKVMMRGAGAALLEHPDRLRDIVSAMRDSTDLPLSAKMRLGITEGAGDPLAAARAIEDGGADMLIVHARYQDQGYAGKAHWEWLRRIRDEVGIPVAGNGDVVDGDSARRMLEETGCALVMVGRFAGGNPHLLTQVDHYLRTGKRMPQTDRREMFREYYSLANGYGIRDGLIKRQAMSFSKGMERSKDLRRELKKLSELEEILQLLTEW